MADVEIETAVELGAKMQQFGARLCELSGGFGVGHFAHHDV